MFAWTGLANAAGRKGPSHKLVRHEPPPMVALNQIRSYEGRPAPFALQAKAALLTANGPDTVLYAFNEHQRIQPASLAKIMTFYIALEAMKDGKIKPTTIVTVSTDAWRLSMDQTVSRMFLEPGQQVSVHDLLLGLMVSSGNDAAVALAEYIAGSKEAFVNLMNDQCAKLGLTETRFASPDGLPEPDQYTTAADMVKLAWIVVRTAPEAFAYTATREFTFHKITQRNWNTLIFYDPRVNGLKTGHVAEAGFHLVATANSHDLQLVSAVMGTRNAEKRRTETEKLLDWAFHTFTTVTPDWKTIAPAKMRVYEGSAESVEIAPVVPPELVVARGEEAQVKLTAAVKSKYLVAPVANGQQVGDLNLTKGSQVVTTIPLQTKAAVARGGFFHVLHDKFAKFL